MGDEPREPQQNNKKSEIKTAQKALVYSTDNQADCPLYHDGNHLKCDFKM